MLPLSPSVDRRWLGAFAAYLTVLIGISGAAYLRILDTGAPIFPHWDTLGHFFLIGGAALLLHLGWCRRQTRLSPSGRWTVASAALVIGALAGADELAQLLSPARSFELIDFAANVAGAVAFPWLADVLIPSGASVPRR